MPSGDEIMPKLLVGLGNPGSRYAATRHNIGWVVLDEFARKHNISVDKVAFEGVTGEARVGTEKLYLLKPMTFMNNSGRSVARAAAFYKIDPREILVIYDDLDLPPGRIRVREKGGSGGHNGMKSLIQEVATQEFGRLRIGVGRPAPGWEVVDWVLAPFNSDDAAVMARVVPLAVEAVEAWLTEGLRSAMNRYNTGDSTASTADE